MVSLVCNGCPTIRMIAAQLNRSPSTVSSEINRNGCCYNPFLGLTYIRPTRKKAKGKCALSASELRNRN